MTEKKDKDIFGVSTTSFFDLFIRIFRKDRSVGAIELPGLRLGGIHPLVFPKTSLGGSFTKCMYHSDLPPTRCEDRNSETEDGHWYEDCHLLAS